VKGGGDGDQEEALEGKRKFDMKKIATDDMAVRGANGHKVGMLRNHSEKTTQESVPEHKGDDDVFKKPKTPKMQENVSEHKEEDDVFKKPKTPKKAREKKVVISFLLIYL